jgi:hypothetical protein
MVGIQAIRLTVGIVQVVDKLIQIPSTIGIVGLYRRSDGRIDHCRGEVVVNI